MYRDSRAKLNKIESILSNLPPNNIMQSSMVVLVINVYIFWLNIYLIYKRDKIFII
jgi:hypothetical protein